MVWLDRGCQTLQLLARQETGEPMVASEGGRLVYITDLVGGAVEGVGWSCGAAIGAERGKYTV
jgi:hypothetical protein